MSKVLQASDVRAVLSKFAGDGASPAGLTISSATNASPAVATFSASHGLVVGDVVFISGTTGLTNLNGVRKVATVPLATTATFTDLFTAAAVNGNGAFGGTVTVQRMLSSICPGDVGDLDAYLNRLTSSKGPFADKDRANESSIQTISGN